MNQEVYCHKFGQTVHDLGKDQTLLEKRAYPPPPQAFCPSMGRIAIAADNYVRFIDLPSFEVSTSKMNPPPLPLNAFRKRSPTRLSLTTPP
jgi:hypothetical protein